MIDQARHVHVAALAAMLLALGFGWGCTDSNEVDDIGPGDGDTDSDTDTDVDTDTDIDTDGDTDTDADSDTDTDTETDICETTEYEIEHNPINMLILLDRSRSMFTNTIETDTYATVVAEALKGVVEALDEADLINFGLATFPSLLCADGELDSEYECTPANDEDNPVVEVGADNFLEIDLALDAVGQCGGTPICESLQWALDYLTGDTFPPDLDDLPKFVLLATDGAPNCNPAGDVGSCTCTAETCQIPEQCLDDLCTYNAALNLAAAGIPVFVIGVGDDLETWSYVMDNVALYGGTNTHFPAANAAELQTALEDITGEAISCTFEVDWSQITDATVAKACDKVAVFGLVDDEWADIPHSPNCADPGGWHWAGEPPAFDADTPYEQYCTEIVLCDDACQDLKDQVIVEISAGFGCYVPPVE